MGSEAKHKRVSSTPKLPLFSIPPMLSSEPPSGMQTPPRHTMVSVPFQWEEEPGKPRPCTALFARTHTMNRCLELPPRLLSEAKIARMPSPTTVLDGPYISKSLFQSYSFRIFSRDQSHGNEREDEMDAMVLSKRSLLGRRKFLNLKRKGEFDRGNFVFSPSAESDPGVYGSESGGGGTRVKMTTIKRSGSFLGLPHRSSSHFWSNIYDGLKQVMPWRSRKLKKERVVI